MALETPFKKDSKNDKIAGCFHSSFKSEFSLDPLIKLGANSPKIVLYLNNTPVWPSSNKLDVPALVEVNGNHWRKIFTIFAKLVTDEDWRSYRDYQLLKQNELICFTQNIEPQASVHIFSGKECWKRFERKVTEITNTQSYESIAEEKVTYKVSSCGDLYLFTPYFDSRQFPNALIAQVKEQLLKAKLAV